MAPNLLSRVSMALRRVTTSIGRISGQHAVSTVCPRQIDSTMPDVEEKPGIMSQIRDLESNNMPKATLWPLDPHTRGKHLVLRAYLDAWLPVLGTWNSRIVFIDGFAGPGEYEGGEDGSPLIALRAFEEHRARGAIQAELVFFFIEKRADRVKHLESKIKELRPNLKGRKYTISVVNGPFDSAVESGLDYLDEQEKRLAPAFVMVDPFGVSGTPMNILRRVLQNPRCEVYVSFMYESMNRFLKSKKFEQHLDALFGCDAWRKAREIAEPAKRKTFIYNVYREQLRLAGAKQVVHFEIFRGNRLIYAIFFGTTNWKAANLMKQAIWRVAPSGDFEFHGTHVPSLSLIPDPDLTPLQNALVREFRGLGWVSIETVEEFVGSDRTDYHIGHLKKGVLKPMEREGELEADGNSRKRKFTFPPNTRLRFL